MSNYDLAFTGAQIDSAIGKVQNAETTVADSTNMIQSAAVFTGLNNLSTTNFTAGTLVTSGETFPDNDTTIPTCAAVQDFVDVAGALTYIPIHPTDFYDSSSNNYFSPTTTRIDSAATAKFTIPEGYNATGFTLTGRNTKVQFDRYTINGSSSTVYGPTNTNASGSTSTVSATFSSPLTFTNVQYLVMDVQIQAALQTIYIFGGYISIQKA